MNEIYHALREQISKCNRFGEHNRSIRNCNSDESVPRIFTVTIEIFLIIIIKLAYNYISN